MFIYVEIANEPVIAGRAFQDKTSGMMKPAVAKQNAYLWSGKAYPLPFTIKVPEAGPYKPGRYMMTGECFKPGEYGLDFRGFDLTLIAFEDAAKFITEKPRAVSAA